MSAQRTEYRSVHDDKLIAVVPDFVLHEQGGVVVIDGLGIMRVYDRLAPVVQRIDNNVMNCCVLHTVKLGAIR